MRRQKWDRAVFLDDPMPVRVLIEHETYEGYAFAENEGQVFVRWICDGVHLAWVPTERVRRLVTA